VEIRQANQQQSQDHDLVAAADIVILVKGE
jgi:hypothetical protein